MSPFGFGKKKPKTPMEKAFRKARRKQRSRPSRKIDEAMSASGFNPNLATCDVCGDEYNVNNQAAWILHAHED